MTEDDWSTGFAKSVGMFLNGHAIPSTDPRGRQILDRSFLLLWNGYHDPIEWTMPDRWDRRWEVVIDTAAPEAEPAEQHVDAAATIKVQGRSVLVLRSLEGDA
jgi:glycogen operon protein